MFAGSSKFYTPLQAIFSFLSKAWDSLKLLNDYGKISARLTAALISASTPLVCQD